MKVGYVYDEYMTQHKSSTPHLEKPERIVAIYNFLQKNGQINKMIQIPSRKATVDELQLAHTGRYVKKIQKLLALPNEQRTIKLLDDPDMYANDYTLDCALLAAGSTLNLVQSIINNQIDRGIAIVRPPGHHAHTHFYEGYCWFNNVAIAALWASQHSKVAVIDWDVHQGDGTKQILKYKKNVIFISIHRSDHGEFYPGLGESVVSENTIMIGLDGDNGDKEYIKIFKEQIVPQLQKFKPDLILVSAGFDAGINDPLGGYDVTPKCFGTLTQLLLTVCPKIALILEGGYNLETISQSMSECVDVLLKN